MKLPRKVRGRPTSAKQRREWKRADKRYIAKHGYSKLFGLLKRAYSEHIDKLMPRPSKIIDRLEGK